MTHSYHEGPEDTIFYDGCLECERKCKDPVIHLDQQRSRKLWQKMLDVEVFQNGDYNSENEATAARSLWRTYLFLERNTTISPTTLHFLS